jgi:hypothetical protein
MQEEERQKKDIQDSLGQIGLRLVLLKLLQLLLAVGALLRVD